MKYSFQYLLGIVVMTGAVFLAATNSVSASTYTVTKTADTNDGSCSAADCSLREAITAADSNTGDDTIVFSVNGTISLSSSTNGYFNITDTTGSLTVSGNGTSSTIIDGTAFGAMDTSLFYLNTNTEVLLSQLTITNVRAPEEGSAINISTSSAQATITDVIIENSTGSGGSGEVGGGAIANYGVLIIADSIIQNNIARVSSALAVNQCGGGIYNTSGATATVTNSTISGNAVDNSEDTSKSGSGGGVCNAGTLSISTSTINSNAVDGSAGNGGGIYNSGTATIVNTTIYGNVADGNGGGFYHTGSNAFRGTFLTIANNISDNDSSGGGNGGGYYNNTGSNIILANSIVANNTDSTGTADDCIAINLVSGGYNIIGDTGGCNYSAAATDMVDTDPLLASVGLANNGGSTKTVLLQSTSPAKDAIPSSTCTDFFGADSPVDQRGVTRPDNSSCEIGAVELDQTAPTISIVGSNPATVECRATYTDAGTTAVDNFDASVSVLTSGSVDTTTLGNYTLTYSASDSTGNAATQKTRTVTVQDTTAPSITITGETSITLTQGETYTDAGATASDTCDSSVSVTISGSVDTSTAAVYTLTYSASDDSGNAATQKTRTVTVSALDNEEDDSVDDDDVPPDEGLNDEEEQQQEEKEERGTITSVVAKKRGKVRVTYSHASSQTFTVFKKGKPKVRLTTDGERIAVLQKTGKRVRIINGYTGTVLASKKLRSKIQNRALLRVWNFYKDQKDEIVILTRKAHKAQLTVVQISENNTLKKWTTKNIYSVPKKKLTIMRKKKQLRVKLSSGEILARYKVKRKKMTTLLVN